MTALQGVKFSEQAPLLNFIVRSTEGAAGGQALEEQRAICRQCRKVVGCQYYESEKGIIDTRPLFSPGGVVESGDPRQSGEASGYANLTTSAAFTPRK